MKYFKIYYGCGCGINEDYITARNQIEADSTAWELAIEDYETFEGLHGIRGLHDIALDDYDTELDEADDATYCSIEQDYLDERESQLDYGAEEITEKEYLIGIGELEDGE